MEVFTCRRDENKGYFGFSVLVDCKLKSIQQQHIFAKAYHYNCQHFCYRRESSQIMMGTEMFGLSSSTCWRILWSGQPKVWPLTQFFPVSFFVKNHWFHWRGKSRMTPHRGNTFLFRSSQQLSRLRLQKGNLSWDGPLQGPSTWLDLLHFRSLLL